MTNYQTNTKITALYNQVGSLRPSEKSDISINILKLPPTIKENLIKSGILTVNDLLNQDQNALLHVPYVGYASIDRIINGLHDYHQGVIQEYYTPEVEPTNLDDSVILLNIDKRIMRGLNNHFNTTQSWKNLRKQHEHDFYYRHILNNDGSILTPLDITIKDLLNFNQEDLLKMRYVGETVVYDLVNKMIDWCNRNEIGTEQFALFNYEPLYSQDRNIVELTPIDQKQNYYDFTLYQADVITDEMKDIRINNEKELLKLLKDKHNVASKIFIVSHPDTDTLFKNIRKVRKEVAKYRFADIHD